MGSPDFQESHGKKICPHWLWDPGRGPSQWETGMSICVVPSGGVQIDSSKVEWRVLLVMPLGWGARLHLGRRDSFLVRAEFYE